MTDNMDEMRQQAMNELALELGLIAMQEPSRNDGLVRYALIDRDDIADMSVTSTGRQGQDMAFDISVTLKPRVGRLVVSFDASSGDGGGERREGVGGRDA